MKNFSLIKRKKNTGLLKKTLFILIFIFVYIMPASAQNDCFRIGMHSGGTMFTNFHRTAFSGFMSDPGGISLKRDQKGYPLYIPDGANFVKNYSALGKLWEDSLFVIKWDGEGELNISGAYGGKVYDDVYNTENRRAEFKTTHKDWPDPGWWHIWFKWIVNNPEKLVPGVDYNPNDPADAAIGHVRNVRVCLKSHEDIVDDPAHVFNPYFLEKIEPFYMIRFMGSFHTNGSGFRVWQDRSTPGYWNQSKGDHGNGLAYEWAIALCNQTKKHLWFNVPHAADDHAIRKMAELVRDKLDPDLNVYLEYSNETWNYAGVFGVQWKYARENGGHPALHVNMCKIWREVFGKDSLRVIRVMAGQSVNPWILWQRVKKAGPEHVDALGATFYFNPRKARENWNQYTTREQMIQDHYDYIRGRFYEELQGNIELSEQYGKPLYFYEGGLGSDPNYHTYADTFRTLQKDPRLKPVIHEVLDSIKSIGAAGGNELSLKGYWNEVPQKVDCPSNDCYKSNFWGTLERLWNNPDDYPKYQAYIDKIEDCDNLVKESDTIGSGNAIRLDGNDDYVNISNAWKPDEITDDYTIETWIHPEMVNQDQTIFASDYSNGNPNNILKITHVNRLKWIVKNNAGGEIVSVNGPLVEMNKHYHIACVKREDYYKIYVNGIHHEERQGNLQGATTKSRMIIGSKTEGNKMIEPFRGRIDEVRIWNTAITTSLIRDWMCKKVNASHPRFSNLKNYYQFDIVDLSGEVRDKGITSAHGQLNNVTFSLRSNYEKSGAPVGDDSKHLYPPNWENVSISYTHPNGDQISVDKMGEGHPHGVHVYLVNQAPFDTTLPSAAYQKMGKYYYGVFMVNGDDAKYRVRYNYVGNPHAGTETAHRLNKRDNNADAEGWENTGAILNTNTNTLYTRPHREKYMGEYILGVRKNVVPNLPGPGYALKFDWNKKAKVFPFNRPYNEYTISMWLKPWGQHAWQKPIQFFGIGGGHNLSAQAVGYTLKISACRNWECSSSKQGRMNRTGWQNLTLIKKDGVLTAYLDGAKVSSIVTGSSSAGQETDADFVKMVVGQNYLGTIDEFAMWDVPLEQELIKEWMCREISGDHPLEESNLRVYYKFDEGQGNLVENQVGPGELKLYGNPEWVLSGAPVGDTSVYTYSDSVLSMNHKNGDVFTTSIRKMNEIKGYHIYRVDAGPKNSAIPSSIKSIDSTHYFGVFVSPKYHYELEEYAYSVKWDFDKNTSIFNNDSIRIMYRTNNASNQWNHKSKPGNLYEERWDVAPYDNVELNEIKNLPKGWERVHYEVSTGSHWNYPPYYSTRFKAYFTPDTTGEYRFYGIANRGLEFHLSTNDSPDGMDSTPEIYFSDLGWIPDKFNNFTQKDIQKSGPVFLEEGKHYYFELYHNKHDNGWQSFFRLGYKRPGGDEIKIVQATCDTNATAERITFFAHKSSQDNRMYGQPKEYMLGSMAPGDISVDDSPPAAPATIYGPSNICAGQTGVVYHIDRGDKAEFYLWTLPGGLTGFSESDSIVVSVDAAASGNIGKIEVLAVNRYGQSSPAVLPIHVEATPGLSVEITGPAEVCSNENHIQYSIPAVQGTIDYNWTVPADAFIFSGQGSNSIQVDFGTNNGNITVDGTFNCGTTMINTKPVIVHGSPDVFLPVSGSRRCLGADEEGFIQLMNSEPDVQYQAFRNGGSSPVGEPDMGNGGQLRINIPLNQLIPGDNVITVKAIKGNCNTETLQNTAIIKVDVAPDPDMAVYAEQDTLCKDLEAAIIVPNSPSGVKYTVINDYEWTVDSDPPYTIEPAVTSPGGYTRLPIPPVPWQQQMAGAGIAMGPNHAVVNAELGSCPTVQLNTEIDIYVRNSPRTLKGGGYNYEYWGVPFTDEDKIEWSFSDNTVCSDEDVVVTFDNAEAGVSYAAFVHNEPHWARPLSDYQGKPLSDTVLCTTEGDNLQVIIPANTLPVGTNKVMFKAFGPHCNAFIGRENSITIYKAPEEGKQLIGTTVCNGDDAEITLKNSQKNIEYKAFLNTVPLGDTLTGDGNNLIFNIPAVSLSLGENHIRIRAVGQSCTERWLEDTATIYVITDLEKDLPVATDYDTLCKGVDANIYVENSQIGVIYQASINTNVVGAPVTGTGDEIEILVPRDTISKYGGQEITIQVQASGGSCVKVVLNNDVTVFVRNIAYPSDDTKLYVPRHSMVCEGEWSTIPYDSLELPIHCWGWRGKVDYLQARVDGDITGYKAPMASNIHHTNLHIERTRFTGGEEHHIDVMGVIEGCPPKKVEAVKHFNGSVFIVPEYVLDAVIYDTVCIGSQPKIGLVNPDPYEMHLSYRLYDPVAGTVVSNNRSTRWHMNGNTLNIKIREPELLHPGKNIFLIQAKASGNGCGWQTLVDTAVVVVQENAETDISLTGESICKADGIVTINNSEPGVLYRVFAGATAIGNPAVGTGTNVSLTVPKSMLYPGVNSISVKAKSGRCPYVNLDTTAIIEVTDTVPDKPAAPMGDGNVCSFAQNVLYQVENDLSVSEYEWFLPIGASTSSTSNIASVNFGSTDGEVYVRAKNICGYSRPSDALHINVLDESDGGSISGGGNYCGPDNIDLALTNYTGNIVKWQTSTDLVNWQDIFSSEPILNTGSLTQPTSYRAVVRVSECDVAFSDTAEVVLYPVLSANTGADFTLEYLHDTILSAEIAGGSGNFDFNWEPADKLLNPESKNPETIVLTETETFVLLVIDTDYGCTVIDTVRVSVVGGPLNLMLIAAEDSVCEGDSTQLTALCSGGSGNYTYTWSNNKNGAFIHVSPTANTSFSVTVSDGYSTINKSITIHKIAIPDPGLDASLSLCNIHAKVNLFEQLNGSPETGGKWYNVTEDIAMSNGNIDLSNSEAGVCEYQYSHDAGKCGTFASTVAVILSEMPFAGKDTSIVLCQDNPATNLFDLLGGQAEENGHWENIDDADGFSAPAFFPDSAHPDTWRFVYKVMGSGACNGYDTATVSVELIALPEIDFAIDDKVICAGEKAEITLANTHKNIQYQMINVSTGNLAGTYRGTGEDMEITLSINENKSYYFIAKNQSGCQAIINDTFTVIVQHAGMLEIEGEYPVCPKAEEIMYHTDYEGNDNLAWEVSNGKIIRESEKAIYVNWGKTGTGTIRLRIANDSATCTTEAMLSVPVEDNEAPMISCPVDQYVQAEYTGFDFEYVVEDISLDITANDNCGEIDRIYNSFNNEATLKGARLNASEVITWTAVDISGNETNCYFTLDVEMKNKIEPPTAFTPNGDGINDYWHIELLTDFYPTAMVRIFDRNGQLVYESEQGYPTPWNGVSKGRNLPMDSYHYIIYLNKTGKVMKGQITIIR